MMGKVFGRVLGIALLAVVTVVVLRSAGRGKIGNWIAGLISTYLGVDWETAARLYFNHVRQYLDIFLGVAIVAFFLLFFWALLSWFTGYFDEIIAGVDWLAGGKGENLVLSPELDFMAEKLGAVKGELERSAAAEREAERRKNDLVLYLAHDIKTPLTSVIGYLSLLDEAPDMPPKQREKYIRIALEKAGRLEGLVGEFFEITRDLLQQESLSRQPVDLCCMLVQVADEAYPQLAAGGRQARLHLPSALCAWVDPDKMARVFQNLLKNAVAYGAPGSDIHIFGSRAGDVVSIRFENAGDIPQEKLEAIFEKFYRLDASRQTATGGAGLGLAIARDIVQRHGGTIRAESGDGRISFTVQLPAGTGGGLSEPAEQNR
ncbi:sensor histidine kinase [Bittarella massiliensis (ex Durand et al. 2017)]|uniref:sensor histidine kinase n=1 Tax=Bittarella massiliensis (ex Durand et al. 2017) TaxID=1720313 RepID=UPI001AA0FE8C|nr:HAMP domain-containing sensor histidine kinase [Bittarella massiliensis (ex Durand et al. 2017)]MBO1679753.1 HAMP domain-containing histidine kinase [Bittarella massiliensis (ex Durand et al. 2017)]